MDIRREILKLLTKKEGLSAPEIARILGLSSSHVNNYLLELFEGGIVIRKKEGMFYRYFIRPDLKRYYEELLMEIDTDKTSRANPWLWIGLAAFVLWLLSKKRGKDESEQ